MKAAEQFTVNARWAMLAKLISAGVSAPFLLLLPRFLGKDQYGQFALTVSVLIGLRMLAGGGLGYAAARFLARRGKAEGDDGSVMFAGLTLQAATGAFVGGVFLLLAAPAAALFASGAFEPTQTLLFELAGIAVVFFALVEFAKAAFQGLQRFQYLALITAIEFGGKLLLAGGLAVAGYGVVSVFGAYALALIVAAGVSLFMMRGVGLSRPPSLGGMWRELFIYNLPLMLTTAGFIIYTEIDVLMLGLLSGYSEVAAYSAAMSISRAAPLFAVPFGQAAAPLVVALLAERQSKAADFVGKLLRYVAAVFIPAAAAIIVTAPHLVKLWGPDYGDAVLPLRVLAFFMVSLSIGVVISPIIDYLGGAGSRAKWMTVSVVANGLLDFLLIPSFGAVGASIATVVTHGPFVLNNLYYVVERIGLSKRALLADVGAITAAAIAAAGVAELAMMWKDNFFLGLAAGAAVYLSAIFAFRLFTRAEIIEVAGLVTRGGGR